MTQLSQKLNQILKVEKGEAPGLAWSFAYFFCLLCGYYVLRPVRDEMGIQGGVKMLQWTFTASFVVMLAAVPVFGWATKRFERTSLVPGVYIFFISNLMVFFFLFQSSVSPAWVARAFFVWVSVFNLFVVSIFWSFMADVFSGEQARRLFGTIAAGGSAGAILGPGLTATLSSYLKVENLLLVSALFFVLALVCVRGLTRWHGANPHAPSTVPQEDETQVDRGGALYAVVRVMRSPYLIGIACFMLLYSTVSTFLYFEQAHIMKASIPSREARTGLFASMDLVVNALTVLAQVFLTSRLVQRFGLPVVLPAIPLLVLIGFVLLGFSPILWTLVAVQVIRRAGNYAITRPAREMLYTVVPTKDKYASKNFIDTVVFRGGDAASGWGFAALSGLGLGLGAMAFVAVPIAGLWAWVGLALGRSHAARDLKTGPDDRQEP